VPPGRGPQSGRSSYRAGRPRDEEGRPLGGGERRGGRTYKPGLHDWTPATDNQGAGRGARNGASEAPARAAGRNGTRPAGAAGAGSGPRGAARPQPAYRSRQDPRRSAAGAEPAADHRPSLGRYGLPQQAGARPGRVSSVAPYFRNGRGADGSASRRDTSLTTGPGNGARPYADLDEPPDGDEAQSDAHARPERRQPETPGLSSNRRLPGERQRIDPQRQTGAPARGDTARRRPHRDRS